MEALKAGAWALVLLALESELLVRSAMMQDWSTLGGCRLMSRTYHLNLNPDRLGTLTLPLPSPPSRY